MMNKVAISIDLDDEATKLEFIADTLMALANALENGNVELPRYALTMPANELYGISQKINELLSKLFEAFKD